MENKKKTALSFLQNSKTEEKIIGSNTKSDLIEENEIVPSVSKKNQMKRKTNAQNKILYSLTIDPDLHKKLKMHSSFTSIPMNKTVEELLIKFFKNNKTFKEEINKFMED